MPGTASQVALYHTLMFRDRLNGEPFIRYRLALINERPGSVLAFNRFQLHNNVFTAKFGYLSITEPEEFPQHVVIMLTQ